MTDQPGRRRQEMAKRHLGRGLSALLGGDENEAQAGAPAAAPVAPTRTAPIEFLHPSAMQPRTQFDEDKLEQLAQSIREKGVLQPILVREHRTNKDEWEIVAGERRWRAAQKAQLHEVPILLKELSDRDTLEIALIENLQRADLTAVDEALGYRRLSDEFKQTQEDIARTVGKSRPHVANTVRLLDLPGAVQEMIRRGELSAGQARALIGLPDPLAVAQRAIDEKLTARDLERLGGELKPKAKGGRPRTAASSTAKSADTKALEKRIEEALGLKADLQLRGLGEQSLLTLEIRDFDQLDTVVERLTRR